MFFLEWSSISQVKNKKIQALVKFHVFLTQKFGCKPRVGKLRVGSGSGIGGPRGGSGGPGGGFVTVVNVMAKPLLRPIRRNHRQDHQNHQQDHQNHYQNPLGVDSPPSLKQ